MKKSNFKNVRAAMLSLAMVTIGGAWAGCGLAPENPLGGSASVLGDSAAAVASGHGHFIFVDPVTGEEGLRTFSFSAVEHQDGTFGGQGQLNNRGQGSTVHFEVNCAIVDGNAFLVTGIVTRVSGDSAAVVGDPVIFGARDNGNGDPPDEITNLFVIDPEFRRETCEEGTALVGQLGGVNVVIDVFLGGTTPIDGGAIQVH